MNKKRSLLFIRDGVLVNRMHINPVAFAIALAIHIPENPVPLEDLVNFGFEKSGYSATDKMRMFVTTHRLPEVDFVAATELYNEIASEAGQHCGYFDGMPDLLARLKSEGNDNYITSAVQQELLDIWLRSPQGQIIDASLTEVLGARPTMTKGRGHFQYVSSKHSRPLVMVADAPSEITTANRFAREFEITTVAFGYCVRPADVSSAFDQLRMILERRQDQCVNRLPARINSRKLILPTEEQIEETLELAGAQYVVRGTEATITSNLKTLLLQLVG